MGDVKTAMHGATDAASDREGAGRPMSDPKAELDPGAYIGHEPEREAETIPGGVKPGDERIAAYDAAPGVPGEPESTRADVQSDRGGEPGTER